MIRTKDFDLAAAPDARAEERPRAETIKVWDLPTRIFHWSLAASFTGAFLTAESERWRDLHVMLGYTLLGLIGFRLVWGCVGSRYARFASFRFGPRRALAYVGKILRGRAERHVGHNPAGAWAIYALLGLGLLASLSGLAVYQDVGGEAFEELHEAVAALMLAMVAIHVAGVVVSSLLHRENLIAAMITGRKRGAADEAIGDEHRRLGVALILAIVGAWMAWSWKSGPTTDEGGEAAAVPVGRPAHRPHADGD